MRRILVAVGSRANWASLHIAVRECIAAGIDTTILAYASAVSDRHGAVVEQANDRMLNVVELPTLVEGGPQAMAATVGAIASGFAPVLSAVKPDVVLVCGDRYDVLPVAFSAAMMNVVVAHTMGGEVSGTIDEGVRHAITKLSHLHFPATPAAARRIEAMGEDTARVYAVGCPRIDFVKDALADVRPVSERTCIVVAQHAVTTEHEEAYAQMSATLEAIGGLSAKEVHIIWPNSDAGGQAIVDAVRDRHATYLTHRALPPADYARLMARAGCIVGNSSSAIREGSWIGTPAVNVGTRQAGRERGRNVLDVQHSRDEIRAAIKRQLEHGPYESDALYGTGDAGKKIAEVLAGELPHCQKRWHEAS